MLCALDFGGQSSIEKKAQLFDVAPFDVPRRWHLSHFADPTREKLEESRLAALLIQKY
jgi:hypothetical protein